jgi:hypothetical protein
MFLREYREEEEAKRNMHSTYTNKPIPTLQLASQVSKFDNSEIRSARSDVTPLPVPTTWDTYYDPNHPDADWSGLVSLKNNQKKHSNSHRSQLSGIEQTELGIISLEEKKEWLHRKPGNGRNGNVIIGGVDIAEEERWKTAAMSFQRQESTAREQLTLDKRMKAKKEIADPLKFKKSFNSSLNEYNPNNSNGTYTETSKYAVSGPSLANRSLIANISHLIISKVPEKPTQSIDNVTVDRKMLFADNYKPSPGYIYF